MTCMMILIAHEFIDVSVEIDHLCTAKYLRDVEKVHCIFYLCVVCLFGIMDKYLIMYHIYRMNDCML